jgi:hypothetical protein
MTEVWLPVVGTEGYDVSDHGQVRSYHRPGRGTTLRTEPVLLSLINDAGRRVVSLGRGNRRFVHHLVLEAFVGPHPDGYECDHADGDPSNNHVTNLRWVTHPENMVLPRERKPYCRNGHLYENNTYWYRGKRCCYVCLRANWTKKDQRRREAKAA